MSLYPSDSAYWQRARAPRRLLPLSFALSILLLALSARILPQAFRLDQKASLRQLEAPAAEWLAKVCPPSHLEVVREFPLRIVATVDCPAETLAGLKPALTGFYDIHEERGEGLLLVRARPSFAWVDHPQMALALALLGLTLLIPSLLLCLQHLRTTWNNRPVKPVYLAKKPGRLQRAAKAVLSLAFLLAVGLQCLPLWVLLGPLALAWRSLRRTRARHKAGQRRREDRCREAILVLNSYPPQQAEKIRQHLGNTELAATTDAAPRAFRLQVRDTFAYHLEQVCQGAASDEAKIAQTLQERYLTISHRRRRIPSCAFCDEVFIDEESLGRHTLTHGIGQRVAAKPRSWRLRWLCRLLAVAACAMFCLEIPDPNSMQRGQRLLEKHTILPLSQTLQNDFRRFADSPAEVAVVDRDGQLSALIAIAPELNSLVLDRASELGLDRRRIFCVPLPTKTNTPIYSLTGLALLGVGCWRRRRNTAAPVPLPQQAQPKPATPPKSVADSILPDPLSLEVGRGLLGLVDPGRGAKLLEQVGSIRRQTAREWGIVLPGVRILDNLALKPNQYVIKVRGCEAARGEVHIDQLLAMGPEEKLKNLRGTKTIDPTYGMPGVWVSPEQRGDIERLGCMVFEPVTVVATQLTEVVRNNAPDLLTYQAACDLLRRDPVSPLVAELERYSVDRRRLWILLRTLLEEGVPICDLERICEAVLAVADQPRDNEELLAYARQALGHAITYPYCIHQNQLHCWEIPEELQGDPTNQDLLTRMREVAERMRLRGFQPVFLSQRQTRRAISQLPVGYGFVVLASGEVPAMIERVAFQE